MIHTKSLSVSRLVFIAFLFTLLLHECNVIKIQDNRRRGNVPDSSKTSKNGMDLHIGVIVPHLTFLKKKVYTELNKAIDNLYSAKPQPQNFNFLKHYKIQKQPILMLELAASPLEILNATCDVLVEQNIVTLLYLTTSDTYGSNAASAQYLLQLTGYLGIPVIAWNADNAGLEQKVSDSKILQLAPSVEHQAMAMLNILKRYSWHAFSIVTSSLGGHEDFIRAVRDLVQREIYPDFKFEIIDVLTLKKRNVKDIMTEMEDLITSEARIMLLFATQSEATEIMAAATEHGLTGRHYVWICAHSVLSINTKRAPGVFPTGMLGVCFNSTSVKLLSELKRALIVFFHGLELFVNNQKNLHNITLQPNMTCSGAGPTRWDKGDILFKYLKDVEIRSSSVPDTAFNADGTVKYVELEIRNINNEGNWHKVGDWNKNGLEIKDIVWPGGSPVPPPGVPEKFNLKVTFMEEPPYVNLGEIDSETGECTISRSVKCRIAPEHKFLDVNLTLAQRNSSFFRCCHGFCIDLLQNFARDLKFSYDLYRVEDGKWGAISMNGTWNGLIAEVLHHKADIVVTSIKINSERQTAADFTVPFLETGISIVVAKRTGIISPKAFLEPFDTVSWLMILLVCIQAAALAIFLFEWLSPHGYDMKMLPPREHKFSLFRTYWLVWAILFGAAVNVDCPRGFAARFVSGVWAMFAVVFLAIYTANLAAFMITREEFYDLQGIEDKRLVNPYSMEPPFRYGTIPHGNTEAVLKRNKPDLYMYMKKFNRSSVREGIASTKNGDLDAFIYDATVLEYLVGQDNECRLLTVGTWYAMTGYGFALPKKSKYLSMFNKAMLHYRENGDLERLQRFWLQGACKPKAQKRNVSKPLDVNQFMSAFLLLGGGVLFTILVLVLEHIYFRYIRKHLAKKDAGGCFTLISLSMGKSLSFRGAVFEAAEMIKSHHCKDPSCDNTLWKTQHELQIAKLKIQQLEAELHGKRRGPLDITTPRDMTKNIVTTTEESSEAARTLHPYGPHFIKTVTTPSDVAEIETVL